MYLGITMIPCRFLSALLKNTLYCAGVAWFTLVLYGCESRGCGGPEPYQPSLTREIRPVDTTVRILGFSYKDKPQQDMNSSSADWMLSVTRPETEMYIHSSLGLDTLVVRREKTMKYVDGGPCSDVITVNITSAIVYHTFDSIYTQLNSNPGGYSNHVETTYFK